MEYSPEFTYSSEKKYDDFFKELTNHVIDLADNFDVLRVFAACVCKPHPKDNELLMYPHKKYDSNEWYTLAEKFVSSQIDGEFCIGSHNTGYESPLYVKLCVKENDDVYVIEASSKPSKCGVKKLKKAGAWHENCRTVMTFKNGQLSFRKDDGRKTF